MSAGTNKEGTARTGISVASCYAAPLRDCSGKLTEEHYFSEAALLLLGAELSVTDARREWDGKQIPAARLVSNVLCNRHNTALSPLDSAATQFLQYLRSVPERLRSGGGADVVSGPILERWLLKVLAGVLAREGEPIPLAWLDVLFGFCAMPPPWGLNVHVRVGDSFRNEERFLVHPARNPSGDAVGISVTAFGHRFVLSLRNGRLYGVEDLGKESIYRLAHMRWDHRRTGTQYKLRFEWEGLAASSDGVSFRYDDQQTQP